MVGLDGLKGGKETKGQRGKGGWTLAVGGHLTSTKTFRDLYNLNPKNQLVFVGS